jgi:outer membrane protein OmpA-like peptidoglycan-associated protein
MLCFALNLSVVQAQRDVSNDYISVRALFPNYQYQINNSWNWKDFSSGIEFEYGHHLTGPLSLAFPLKIAQVKYPIDATGRTLSEGGMFGLDGLLHLRPFKPNVFLNPNVFAGLGANYEDMEDLNLALPLGLGLDLKLGRSVFLSTKGEYRIGFKDLRDNIQLGAGLKIFLGGEVDNSASKDSDKDGVVDTEDQCPTVPGPAKTMGCPDNDNDGIANSKDECPEQAGSVTTNGCPDGDNDGIADSKDQCPTEAGTAANNGCPDSDNDGIVNSKDQCPNEAGPASNNGCPIRDADGDGIVDAEDECPNAAGGRATKGCPDRDGDGIADKNDACPEVRGSAANRGCPDTDGDGVIDSADKCPNQAGPASNNGCPEITQKDKETLNFAARNVQFETGSAVLKTTSNTILDQVVDILKRYSDYNVRISGHTDNVGSDDLNLKLSKARAKACNDYLVAKGIDATRIMHDGYGESRPVGNNATPQGRAQNRRTEFELYQK